MSGQSDARAFLFDSLHTSSGKPTHILAGSQAALKIPAFWSGGLHHVAPFSRAFRAYAAPVARSAECKHRAACGERRQRRGAAAARVRAAMSELARRLGLPPGLCSRQMVVMCAFTLLLHAKPSEPHLARARRGVCGAGRR